MSEFFTPTMFHVWFGTCLRGRWIARFAVLDVCALIRLVRLWHV